LGSDATLTTTEFGCIHSDGILNLADGTAVTIADEFCMASLKIGTEEMLSSTLQFKCNLLIRPFLGEKRITDFSSTEYTVQPSDASIDASGLPNISDLLIMVTVVESNRSPNGFMGQKFFLFRHLCNILTTAVCIFEFTGINK